MKAKEQFMNFKKLKIVTLSLTNTYMIHVRTIEDD